jgi:hypothetical protein
MRAIRRTAPKRPMCIAAALVSALPNFAAAQTKCTSGTAASMAASASGVEYPLGQPRTFRVNDKGDIRTIHYAKVGEHAVFEGDIVLGDASQIEFAALSGPVEMYRQQSGQTDITPFGYIARSVLSGAQKWPSNTVPFVIDSSLPSGPLVRSAMKAWSDVTPIRFVERTPQNSASYPNYVTFILGTNPIACLSYGVGMMGGGQRVELVSGCGFGQIVHEIGHVLGLDHEQNREDRGSFVRVEKGNIIDGYAYAFEQRPSLYKDAGQYDYDSIMHYEATAFSCNEKPTLLPVGALPPGIQIGQRTHISQGDIAVIKSVYK